MPIERTWDVVFSSNTLEHFAKPWDMLARLEALARSALAILVPFREMQRHHEHSYTFLPENIPFAVGEMHLVCAKAIDASSEPAAMWNGRQLLLIYVARKFSRDLSISLSDLAWVTEGADTKERAFEQARAAAATLRDELQAERDAHAAQSAAAQAEAERALAQEQAQAATLRDELRTARDAHAEQSRLAAAAQAETERALERERAELEVERSRSAILDAIRSGWQRRAEELERSTSWRVTAPFRTISIAARIAGDGRGYARRLRWLKQISREHGWRTALVWTLGRLRSGPATIRLPKSGTALTAAAQHALSSGVSDATVGSTVSLSPAFELIQRPFNPYSLIEPIKPVQVDVLDQPHEGDVPAFSCVMTVLNEGAALTCFLDSLAAQSAHPAELILVDGGSDDDTVTVTREWAKTSAFPVRVIEAGRVNIAEGRNIGARRANNDIILFVDAGTVLMPDFCRNMVGAFAGRADLDVACGLYRAEQDNEYSRAFIWNWAASGFDWHRFLPSARALAVRFSAFERVGGFPEHLTRTGEDTLFAIRLHQVSQRWAVCRHAMVIWKAPSNEAERDKLFRSYAYGDGESGFGDFRAYGAIIARTTAPTLPATWIEGYRAGRMKRAEVEYHRRGIRRLVVILSGVPFTDSGGGQRCSQLAMAFARQGCKIVFVNIYPSFEEERQLYFDIDLSLFEFYALRDFDAVEMGRRYGDFEDLEVLVISEFPHPSLLPVIEILKKRFQARASIIYDYIDNWQTSLGWEWYQRDVEDRFIAEADFLVASARTLRDELEKTGGRLVELIPNAVNQRLFDRNARWQRPDDLPLGGPIVTYTGAMWGDWFDWELLEACAKGLPEAHFVLIGGVDAARRQELSVHYPNIHFLGLKPQRDLPAYLAFSDAAIIPFRPGDVTTFVNPLKVYEYVAMAIPVVASNMPEVVGIPGVMVTDGREDFCRAVDAAIRSVPPVDDMMSFIDANNWDQRIASFLRLSPLVRRVIPHVVSACPRAEP
jgi:glycosyltransferase involved in cell wall biosynthesis